ncbi:hypothetical protein HPB51_008693 [Rhipicephalus microplus]|uniref:Uncharacterized protein n=1 Tax=Rhipicephalus microplus TaxID=6941 RepID=A0A9J6EZT0_RHIMP|nr:hypothetical protein HPB51_008693 [Rhipicephalus microplus]
MRRRCPTTRKRRPAGPCRKQRQASLGGGGLAAKFIRPLLPGTVVGRVRGPSFVHTRREQRWQKYAETDRAPQEHFVMTHSNLLVEAWLTTVGGPQRHIEMMTSGGGRDSSGKAMQKYADEIAGFEREVAESSLVDITAKVTEVQVKIQECNRDISSVSNEKATADDFIKDKQRESNAVVQEIKRLNDLSNQRLELLRWRSRDAYEATMWLQQNEGRFKGKIYPPIMTQAGTPFFCRFHLSGLLDLEEQYGSKIDLMNASDAKYVEAQIPLRDLLAFVAEYPEDLNSFLGTIRDSRNLRVNGVVVPAESLDSFKPRRPLSEIKRCGFRAYIKSLFSAPDGVMRYLCKRHRVHDIPVGDARTEDCLEEVRRLGMRRFFTEGQFVHHQSVAVRPFTNHDHMLGGVALAEEIAARTAEVKNLNAKDRTLQQQLEELRTAKKRWLNELSHIRQLNMLLEQKREALERLRNEAIDLDAEHRKAAAEQRKICSCRVKEARNFANKLQECHKKHREFAEHRLDMVKVLVDRKKAEEKLRVVQNEYCSLENRVKSMKEDLLRLKREAQKCRVAERLLIAVDHLAANLPLRASPYAAVEMVNISWAGVMATCARNCFREADFVDVVPDAEPEASEQDHCGGDLWQRVVESDLERAGGTSVAMV